MIYLMILNTLIQSAYSFVSESDLNNYSCNGGGYNYKSDQVIEKYEYSEFKSENPNCNEIVETKTDGLSFVENHKKILSFAKDNNSAETCPEILPLIGKYKSQSKDVEGFITDITKKRNKNIFKNSIMLDSKFDKVFNSGDKNIYSEEFQLRSISLANTAVLCGVSDMSLKVSPLWKLKVGLLEEPVSAGTEIIGESGQTTESCLNVQATGSEDLKNFFVTVKHADINVPLSIKYETYSAKDRVVLTLDGEQVFDSGCVGENKELKIPLKENSEKLKVEVFAKCAGASGTSWKIGVTCKEKEKEPEPKTQACLDQISELISYVDQGIFLSRGILKHYWMKSNCYGEYYEKVKGELVDLTKLVKSHEINKCSDKKCSKRVNQKLFKGLNFKDPPKPEGFKPITKNNKSSKNILNKVGGDSEKLFKGSKDNKQMFLNKKGWFNNRKQSINPKLKGSKTKTSQIAIENSLEVSKDEDFKNSDETSDSIKLNETNSEGFRNLSKDRKSIIEDKDVNSLKISNTPKDFVSAENSKAEINIKTKKEFLENKFKYCINNQKIPGIFAIVSFRYCLTGFPELLKFKASAYSLE